MCQKTSGIAAVILSAWTKLKHGDTANVLVVA